MTTRVPVILLGLGLVACSGGSGDDGVDGAPADATVACQLATTYQSFTMIQTQIFQRQCSFMDCHDALLPAAMMDLTGATAHGSLVNVPSALAFAAGWTRVVPNNAEMSYLMAILGDVPGPIDPMVGTMPSNSPFICREKRAAITRWILAGAPND